MHPQDHIRLGLGILLVPPGLLHGQFNKGDKPYQTHIQTCTECLGTLYLIDSIYIPFKESNIYNVPKIYRKHIKDVARLGKKHLMQERWTHNAIRFIDAFI